MRLREFRRRDAPRMFALLKSEFPEEEAILGMRADGFAEVVRRVYRLDLRLLLGLMNVFGRVPFRLYVIEEDGAIAGTTLLTFAARTGFLSTVVVAPEFRRRGFARRLVEASREATRRRRLPYVALNVLESNAPARALYDSCGYRTLRRQTFMVHDAPSSFPPASPPAGIRPFAKADAARLAEIASTSLPELAREVMPVRPGDLSSGSMADRLFAAESAAWVVDRGDGPLAHLGATTTPLTDAAHLTSPIVAENAEPALVAELVRVACGWLAPRAPSRIVASVTEENRRGHLALEEAGFHDALALLTLYRPSA